jgi:hypothetical protein
MTAKIVAQSGIDEAVRNIKAYGLLIGRLDLEHQSPCFGEQILDLFQQHAADTPALRGGSTRAGAAVTVSPLSSAAAECHAGQSLAVVSDQIFRAWRVSRAVNDVTECHSLVISATFSTP